MKKLISFSVLIIISLYFTEKFFQWPIANHQSVFLHEATSFYPTKINHMKNNFMKSDENAKVEIENSELKLRELEKDINILFESSSKNILKNISLIKSKQSEMKIILSTADRKIDQSIFLDPLFRISICIYLDVSCEDLNESNWSNGEISTVAWNKLYLASQSNDFKLLIYDNALTKEKLNILLKKY